MLAREKFAAATTIRPEARAGHRHRVVAALLAMGVAGAGGCEDPVSAPIIRTLDGPTAVAFTCYGRMRVTNGEVATDDQPIIASAMPVSACQAWDQVPDQPGAADAPQPPPGQEPLNGGVDQATWKALVSVFGFVLQKQEGTLAVVQSTLGISQPGGSDGALLPGSFGLIDADRFSPGKNAIPMGTLPVGVVTDPTGCHVMTANAGSCDLSLLEVDSALQFDRLPQVRRVDIVNAEGERIGAKPRAVVGQPGSGPIGFECSAEPDSLVYVAYPDCNMVAVVHAASGEVRAGIVFHEDGSAELTDGNVGCSAMTCGGSVSSPGGGPGPDAAPVDEPDAGADPVVDAGTGADLDAGPGLAALADGAPRPVALFIDEVDTGNDVIQRRLYIGAENSPQVTVVELDDAYLPVESWSVPLEGEVGVTRLAATEIVRMGGDDGVLGGGGFGDFRFVYAIATDKTVRVAEVHGQRRECDTQIDPRYLREVRNGGLLACLPVGDPAYPRRATATSPGILMPNDAVPLDVAFAAVAGSSTSTSPANLVGHFAFITMSTGGTLVVNIDDDRYADFEDTSDPMLVDISAVLAHQPRDGVGNRSGSLYCRRDGADSDGCDYQAPVTSCTPQSISISELGPRLGSATTGQLSNPVAVANEKIDYLPSLRQVSCHESELDLPVSELAFAAPDYLREYTYPDIQSVLNETWTITWEGRISLDGSSDSTVRLGYASTDGGFALHDGSAPFCRMGVEPYDLVTLVGCDPNRGNAHCKLGEVCYVHPDAPTTLGTGMCLPEDRADELAESCRDLLTSRRRFTVLETRANRLSLGERRRVLRTTPVDGCVDDAQCETLYGAELALASDEDAVNLCTPGDGVDSPYAWSCEADPTRAPGPDRCVMTCEQDSECEEGWLCSGGYCVESTLPPAACLGALQRYDVRVGDAFAAVGTRTGFLSQRMVDPDTGMCVDDPAAHPLAQGRLPLAAPPCPTGDINGPGDLDGVEALSPNPCAVVVSHAQEDDQDQLQVRDAAAIRFRNPAFTIHLVDPVIEASCSGSETDVAVPTVFSGYQLQFPIVGGFIPLQVASEVRTSSDFRYDVRYPVSIARGPLGNLWIMDQGDISSAIRGQLLRLDPRSPGPQAPGIQ